MASTTIRYILLGSVLALAACNVRSPDLPATKHTVGPITVTCVPSTLAAGQTAQCSATASCTATSINAQGIPSTNTQCPATQWSSNPATVGTIDPNSGLLTAVAPGTVAVTANIGGATQGVPVIVSAACATGIAITPASVPSLAAGQSQQFTATATNSDGTTSNVSAQTTWSLTPHDTNSTTTDTGVATIDSSGDATSGLVTTNAALATSTT
ncbi:MAG: hypothetical protein ACRETA_13410, partial [Gammaproteobacteria bacterium]